MKHIDPKIRTHINRNIRLCEKLYGSAVAASFYYDALDWCLDHERDPEFAGILEKSHPQLLAAGLLRVEDPMNLLPKWRQELAFDLMPPVPHAETPMLPPPQSQLAAAWASFDW